MSRTITFDFGALPVAEPEALVSEPVIPPTGVVTPEYVGAAVQSGFQQAAAIDPAKWSEIVADGMDLAAKSKDLYATVTPIWPTVQAKAVAWWGSLVTFVTAVATAVGFVKGLVNSFRKG